MAYGDLDLRNKKYYVEVIQYDSIRRFEDCTYTYFSEKNELHIVTSKGISIKFIGNFSAEITSMEDYKKTFNVHD